MSDTTTAPAPQAVEDEPQHTNALIHEKSPYLLQHAHNPVNWLPWGEEAFKKAREEEEDAESDGEGNAATEDKPPEDTEDQAREKGREAHAAGAKITQNPYPAGSRNRAAWDEAWCEADGSDGMDVPDAWRRAPKEEEEPEGEDA